MGTHYGPLDTITKLTRLCRQLEQELIAATSDSVCTRSHPHEMMDSVCKRFAEYERNLADHRRRRSELISLLKDDGYAITFQGLGQYRHALLNAMGAT